jgi:RNA polymerase sigma-54 factor
VARNAFRQGLSQQARQEMRLAPRMLQAIETLQLPTLELATFLRDAFEENVALSLEEPVAPSRPRGDRGATERHDEMLRNQPDREADLATLIEEQLPLLDVGPAELEWVRLLVRSLDANGWLTPTDEELLARAEEAGLEGGRAALGRAVGALQTLEPRGIGGRDAVESLLLQLDPTGEDYGLLCRLVEEFLDEVAKNKLPGVARALGCDLERLEELLVDLRGLEPRPAAGMCEDTAPPIRPEVVVERTETGYDVRVDHSGLPAVSIDEEVRAMASDRELPGEVREYLRGRLEAGRWIVDSVEQRRHTLLRVARALFARQRAFLDEGEGHLVPLRMGDLADELELSTSTVSRACAGVYAQTPRGIVSLRRLFQSAGGNGATALDDLRSRVRELFAAEDPNAPLSDGSAVTRLAAQGFEVARRTVAKYRKELGIPSSYRRRRHAG